MTAQELVRRLRKYARKRGMALLVDPGRGKGDHVRVTLAGRVSMLPGTRGELKTATFRSICKELAVDPKEL